MIYWHFTWHKLTHLSIAAFYLFYGGLVLFLFLPWPLKLGYMALVGYGYYLTCRHVASKPLALVYRDSHWSAIENHRIQSLDLISAIKLPWFVVLGFNPQEQPEIIQRYTIFASDICVSTETDSGSWRQLLAVLNLMPGQDSKERHLFWK